MVGGGGEAGADFFQQLKLDDQVDCNDAQPDSC